MSEIKLLQGDCFELIKQIPDKSIDLVITDPPYEVHAGKYISGSSKGWNLNFLFEKQDITKGYDLSYFSNLIFNKMKTPNIYFWASKKQIPAYIDIWVNKFKCAFEILCWHKDNALPTYRNKYLSDTEYCLYFHIGKCEPTSYEKARTFWVQSINIKDKKKYFHPTIKPLNIISTLIENSSSENDTVLDCFMGSGSTGVACKNLNRNFIGMELNEEYFDIAKQRIENGFVQKGMSEDELNLFPLFSQ